MRFGRIALLAPTLLASVLALVVVPAALAIAFTDESFFTPVGEVGKPYSHQFQIRPGGGCGPPYKYTVLSGQLPPGITLDRDSGKVTGTPTTAGSFGFSLQGEDIPTAICFPPPPPNPLPEPDATQRDFTINIVAALSVQQQAVPSPAFVNEPYSFQVTASGGGTQTWSIASGSLPPGIAFSPGGLLSGTPTTPGDYQFVVRVSDGSRSDSETFIIRVVQRLAAAAPPISPAEVGIAFTTAVSATGGRAPYTWSLTGGTLPTGLTLDPATGTISGTPTAAGTFSATLTVTDSLALTAQVDLPLTVAAKLAIATKKLKAAKEDKRYSAKIVTANGVSPKTYKLRGKVPPGLRFNTRTGVLSGKPTKAGTFRLTFEVTDRLGAKAKTTLVLKVLEA
jgi:large repetitive protein